MTQQVHYWLYTPQKQKTKNKTKQNPKNTSSKGYLHYSVHIIIIYNCQDMEAT